MKIRKGFVSNSSTTSFCIVGICFDKEKLAEKLVDEYREKCEDFDDLDHIIYDVLDSGFEKNKMEIYFGPDDNIYVGLDISAMKEEQTLKEFKELAIEKMSKFFKGVKKVDLIVDGWGDY